MTWNTFLQAYDPQKWHTTRELLLTHNEITHMAAGAKAKRVNFFTELQGLNMLNEVKNAVNHTTRLVRMERLKRQLAPIVNPIGLQNDCIFQRLGYFRYDCHAHAQM